MAPRKKRTRRGKGEGAIYQRADGKWCASVDLGIVAGKRKRKVVYGTTRKEVADKVKALHSAQQQGQNITPERMTVQEFLDRWLTEIVRVRLRPRTVESYEGMIKLHIAPHLGHHQLQKLAPADVQAMLNAMGATGLSARTVSYARGVLGRALAVAVKWGDVPRNVAQLADPPPAHPRKKGVLDTKQARLLLAAVEHHRLAALYRLAVGLGMRRGELLGLRVQDVDWQGCTLTISGSLQRINNTGLVRGAPKTEGAARVLPLSPALIVALRQHQQRQEVERTHAGGSWQASGLVFTSTVGTAIDPRSFIRGFKLILVQAGLPDVPFHSLRHTAATLLVSAGVHPRIAAELLGHAEISTTMDIYAGALPDDQRAAATALDALLAPAPESAEVPNEP